MPSWKAAQAAAESLGRLYGDAVRVSYHNLDDPQEREALQELLAAFAEEGWPLPVTLIDGEPLFVGGLQPARLVVEVARKLAHRAPDRSKTRAITVLYQ
ncbi:MAG: hypothetical protein KatS3mg057_2385 [Herpetosiphonaceae bacterium]|nr:MAG: hypothetical protein KatS3mg057_2385 [Herpetosiphonaceae bacterium]